MWLLLLVIIVILAAGYGAIAFSPFFWFLVAAVLAFAVLERGRL